jgi:hypothetical protein
VLASYSVLGPLVADREYAGATTWAIVASVAGVGALLGDVVSLRVKRTRPLTVGNLVSIGLMPVLVAPAFTAPASVLVVCALFFGASSARTDLLHPNARPNRLGLLVVKGLKLAASAAQDAARLRRNCERYARKYGYKASDLERGLEGYAAHIFAQEDGFNAVLDGAPTDEADLSDRICRDNDLGIDAVLQDEVNKRIILIQAAWRNKDLEEDKVAAFFDAPGRLASMKYRTTGGEHIQDLLDDFEFAVKDGWEISLRFVTNSRIGAKERLLELVDAQNQKYSDNEQSISCELYGETELLAADDELHAATHGGVAQEVSLTFQTGKFIQFNDPYPTIVGVLKGNELRDLYYRNGVKNTLFNLNIRLPLTSKRVNPDIVKTASKDGKNFFYYNNGVSAVCSEWTVDANNTVKIKGIQVINGAQTVNALAKALRKSGNNDVYVMFRLTQTPDQSSSDFTDSIIRFNNTQNPVKVSDFFSNDPIQEWLSRNLKTLSGKGPIPAFYYQPKQGPKPLGATGKAIRIEQAASIRHAFIHGPVPGYREPKQFFENKSEPTSRYWEAFGSEGLETQTWSDEELAEFGAAFAINEKILAIAKNAKAEDTSESKYLQRLSRYALALTAVGLQEIQSHTFTDYQTLVASQATFDKHVVPVLDEARRLMRAEWRNRTSGDEVRPEYNFARDATTWIKLADGMRDETRSVILPALKK